MIRGERYPLPTPFFRIISSLLSGFWSGFCGSCTVQRGETFVSFPLGYVSHPVYGGTVSFRTVGLLERVAFHSPLPVTKYVSSLLTVERNRVGRSCSTSFATQTEQENSEQEPTPTNWVSEIKSKLQTEERFSWMAVMLGCSFGEEVYSCTGRSRVPS